MRMSPQTANRWVVISALVVVGVYAYRRLTEGASPGGIKNIVGLGNPVPLGQFMTAWGFTFLVISIVASAAPELGGSFAILVMTGDLLTNTAAVTTDVGKQQKSKGDGTGTALTAASISSSSTGQLGSFPSPMPAFPATPELSGSTFMLGGHTLTRNPPTPLPHG